MASSKEYFNYITEQLNGLEDVSYRAMMGEYIIYYKGRVAGGIYDDRLLVKAVNAAVSYMADIAYEKPYEGGRDMLLVDNVDDREYLHGLFRAMYPELTEPKK